MWSERERGIAATEPSSNDDGAWGNSNTGSRAPKHGRRLETCVIGGQPQLRIRWSWLENRAYGNRAHIVLTKTVHRLRVVTVMTANCQHYAGHIVVRRNDRNQRRRIVCLDTIPRIASLSHSLPNPPIRNRRN